MRLTAGEARAAESEPVWGLGDLGTSPSGSAIKRAATFDAELRIGSDNVVDEDDSVEGLRFPSIGGGMTLVGASFLGSSLLPLIERVPTGEIGLTIGPCSVGVGEGFVAGFPSVKGAVTLEGLSTSFLGATFLVDMLDIILLRSSSRIFSIKIDFFFAPVTIPRLLSSSLSSTDDFDSKSVRESKVCEAKRRA